MKTTSDDDMIERYLKEHKVTYLYVIQILFV